MIILIFFLFQLVGLFFLSQQLTKHLSKVFYTLFHHQRIVIHLLSFLFLPGVILHELSHFLIASICMVPTGEIEFLPEVHGNEVKMGSVAIAKTDPFRRFVIGVAPLLMGLGVLFILFWYFYPIKVLLSWETALLFYLIFEISNTMFSSKKDMEGAVGLLIAIALLLVVLFFLGVRFPQTIWPLFLNISFMDVVTSMNIFLFLAVFLDSIIIAGCQLFFLRRKHY